MRIRVIAKLMCAVMAAAVCFGSIPVNAATNEETIALWSGMDLDVAEDTSKYDELRDELRERGQEILSAQKARGSVTSTVTLSGISWLGQADSRWSSITMQTAGLTIGSSGCTLTSFTMVRNFLSGTSDTPATVNSVMGNYACPFYWNQAASYYGYSVIFANSNDSGISGADEVIIGIIDSYELPSIIGLKNSSGNTHFVVAYGYDTTGEIIIRDPASSSVSLLSYYLNNGYYVHRIYTYFA